MHLRVMPYDVKAIHNDKNLNMAHMKFYNSITFKMALNHCKCALKMNLITKWNLISAQILTSSKKIYWKKNRTTPTHNLSFLFCKNKLLCGFLWVLKIMCLQCHFKILTREKLKNAFVIFVRCMNFMLHFSIIRQLAKKCAHSLVYIARHNSVQCMKMWVKQSHAIF